MPIFGLFVLFIVSIRAEQCLPSSLHKNTSSEATKDYAECNAWSKDTCCTADFTEKLNQTRTRELYGFHWGHCKNISKKCEQFLIDEECFYSCEPRLIRWRHTNAPVNPSVKGVPICGDYCDDWYEACKDDETCVKDWQVGFDYSNMTYTCPKNATCSTFKQVYGSGKELCNTMWGKSFLYVDPKCPCSRMDGPIPGNVDETSTCSASSKMTLFSAFSLLILIGINLC